MGLVVVFVAVWVLSVLKRADEALCCRLRQLLCMSFACIKGGLGGGCLSGPYHVSCAVTRVMKGH